MEEIFSHKLSKKGKERKKGKKNFAKIAASKGRKEEKSDFISAQKKSREIEKKKKTSTPLGSYVHVLKIHIRQDTCSIFELGNVVVGTSSSTVHYADAITITVSNFTW